MKPVQWVALFGFLAVAGGAFGAHALKATVTPAMLDVYQTGVFYHFTHTLAAAAVLAIFGHKPAGVARLSFILFLAGVVIFSGSLYALVLTGLSWLGAITPVGGVILLAAWVCMFWGGKGEIDER